jgi:hypothetical protein
MRGLLRSDGDSLARSEGEPGKKSLENTGRLKKSKKTKELREEEEGGREFLGDVMSVTDRE